MTGTDFVGYGIYASYRGSGVTRVMVRVFLVGESEGSLSL